MTDSWLKTWIFPVQTLHCWCRSHSCVCWCLLEDVGLICWSHCCVLYCDSTLPPATQGVSDHNVHCTQIWRNTSRFVIKTSRHVVSEWRHLLLFTSCLGLLLASRDWSLLRSWDALQERSRREREKKKKSYQVICFGHIRKTHLKFGNITLGRRWPQLTCSGFLWISGATFLLVSLF